MARVLFGPLPAIFRDFPGQALAPLRASQEVLAFDARGEWD
jgi:hypothetical protein